MAGALPAVAADGLTGTVFAVLLVAAAMHATWNAIIKAGRDKALAMATVVLTSSAIALATLPFLPLPRVESWPFLLLSCIFQAVYALLLPPIYRAVDMGLAYPLMRGAAPLLVTLFGIWVLGEHLPPMALAGIGAISAAILVMAAGGRAAGPRALALPLVNAGMIAAYTLVDATGARLSGAALSYTMWMFVVNGAMVMAWSLGSGSLSLRALRGADWGRGLTGGIGTLGSYGLALWAMTQAPVAMVSALRETSILFGALISVLVLGEPAGRLRILGAVGIAAGAAALRLA